MSDFGCVCVRFELSSNTASGIKEKQGTGNMARRSPAVNIPTLERLRQQDPAQGI